jgi:hypothetical protein
MLWRFQYPIFLFVQATDKLERDRILMFVNALIKNKVIHVVIQ